MPEAPWGRHSRWLTCLTVNPDELGVDRELLRLALEAENIESRPVWKPMHMQPLYADRECIGGSVARELFERGLCLPSGSNLTAHDRCRVVETIRRAAGA
jgi:pyridoxal phosphate-dependent aminotransferase EpsN